MKKESAGILTLLFLMCWYPLIPKALSGTQPRSLQKGIAKLFIKYKIPGASIAVVQNGKLLWTDTLGSTDIGTNKPIEVDTVFQACSITKTLTSTAVLQILNKYNISLDAPVNDYLKDGKFQKINSH